MVGYRWTLAFLVAVGLTTAGCGGSGTATDGGGTATGEGDAHAGHDHDHEHADPETLAEAVEVLNEIKAELAEAYAAADVKQVDAVWHEMYPVAKKAKELAMAATDDQYKQKDAETSAQQIIDILEELHPPHGADAKVDPADFEGQADSLADAINNLKTLADESGSAE